MKTTLQTILLAGMLSCPVQAIEFTGTITGTFVDTWPPFDPALEEGAPNYLLDIFSPGETWTLTYAYESDTIDGTFRYALDNPNNPTFRDYQGGGIGPGPIAREWGLGIYAITVVDAQIETFTLLDAGTGWIIETRGHTGYWQYDWEDAGTVSITDPVASSPVSVPDSGPGILMSAFVFAVMLARRYK